MIEVKLVDHIKDRLGLEAYPLIVPNDGEYPCIVYQVVSETDEISINYQSPHTTNYYIQLDLYTKTYKEVKRLKALLKEALYEFERPIAQMSITETKDDEYYRTMIEFEIFV